ncbi:MAG: hypothetical protein O3A02_01265 [bacterium]|nr:hypothetical protein [bacterium]
MPIAGELTPESGQNFKDGSFLDVLVLHSAGQETVEVRVESDDFDTHLVLFAPDGSLIDSNDDVYDGDGAFASRVRTYLPTAGTYLVVVSGFGPSDLGRYTVVRDAYVLPDKVVVDAVFPGLYEGYLNEAMADMYWITLTEATSVVATLRSFAFDTVLEVYGSDGRFVASNDDFDGADSQVVVDLEAGRYEFLVKGYWEEAEGAYTLEFDVFESMAMEPSDVATPGTFDVATPGTLEGWLPANGFHTYVVTLAMASKVTVDVRSTEFDAYLDAYTAFGNWIDANDDFEGSDARLVLKLEPGTYEFDVSAFSEFSSGAYTVTFDW